MKGKHLVQIRFIVFFLSTLSFIFIGMIAAYAANGNDRPNGLAFNDLKITNNINYSYNASFGSYLAGRFAKNSFDFGAAANFLTKHQEASANDKFVQRQMIFSLLASGNMYAAKRLIEKEIKSDKTSSVVPLAFFVSATKGKRFDIALKRLAFMPDDGINKLIVPLFRAWLFVGMEKYQKAIEALSSISDINEFNSLRNYHTALIRDLAGDPNEAERAFLDALRSMSSARTSEAYGKFLIRAERFEEAHELFIRYGRNNGIVSSDKASSIAKLSSRPRPDRLIGTVLDGVAEVLLNISNLFNQNRAASLALIYSQLALWIKPSFPAAKLFVGEIYDGMERKEDALRFFTSVEKNSSYYWTAQLRRSTILNNLKRSGEAVALLRRMAKEKPERTDALIYLGDILRGSKEYLLASAVYSQAINRIKNARVNDWSLYYSRGITFERAKQWDNAEKDFLKALKLQPNQPLVLNYLGYSWVDQGRNLARAKKMIEEAAKRRPNDGYIVDSLGWALYRMGKFRSATFYLERAVTLRPEDPTINDHLGDAYWRVGRLREAGFQWRRVLTLKPDIEQRELIKAKLRRGLQKALKPRNER